MILNFVGKCFLFLGRVAKRLGPLGVLSITVEVNMACPKCGCKVHYPYYEDDEQCETVEERCAHCGCIFDVEMGIPDDDEQ